MPVSPSAHRGRRPDPALHALWRQRLVRFGRSGLSAAAFCAPRGRPTPRLLRLATTIARLARSTGYPQRRAAR